MSISAEAPHATHRHRTPVRKLITDSLGYRDQNRGTRAAPSSNAAARTLTFACR